MFVYRSLVRLCVPALLRAAGLRLVTLSEGYGISADETVPDDQRLKDAGQRGEAMLMQDARIRYRPAEKATPVAYAVRCFCLTGGNLTGTRWRRAFSTISTPSRRPVRNGDPSSFAVQR